MSDRNDKKRNSEIPSFVNCLTKRIAIYRIGPLT